MSTDLAHSLNHDRQLPYKSRICVRFQRRQAVTQTFRITLLAMLALIAAAAWFTPLAQAQGGLRFNPGGFAPVAPYSTQGSILDLMPAPQAETNAETTKPEDTPEAAAGPSVVAPSEQAAATIHQGLSPERANAATGLAPVRGTSPAPAMMGSSVPNEAPVPAVAPSPYTTPRSPGGGLRVR